MKLSVLTLLAAISEGKKKLLKDRYGATDEQLALIDAADPTQSGTFAEWLTRSWLRDHEFHLPEDQDMVRRELGKFNRVKNRPEWTANHHSNQIMQYNRQQLREALESIEETEEKPSNLPELSDKAIVIYQDATYTLWKINNPQDAMKLSEPAGWCTKGLHMAESYCSEGSLYPAYKDGEPFFQYHPGGKNTGRPQFMNKHNSTMQSVKVMNEEAYNLIKKGEAPSHDPNLAKVVDEFTAPNLSEAETLAYLQDVLKTNPDYAKGNKEFQELETKFVGARYRIFDEEELIALLNKYPRTGDIVTKFLNENSTVKKLGEKIDGIDSFKIFCDAANGDKETGLKFTNEERTLIGRIPGLFSKVFALFSKANDFDAQVAKLKELIKEKKSDEAFRLSAELSATIAQAFHYGYRYNDEIPRWNNQEGQKASIRYQNILTNMVRTLMSTTLTDIEAKADSMEFTKLVKTVNDAVAKIKDAAPHDRKLVEWCDKRQAEIITPVAEKMLDNISLDWSLEDTLRRVQTVRKELAEILGYRSPVFATINEKEKKYAEEKIGILFDEIDTAQPLATKMEEGLAIINTVGHTNSDFKILAITRLRGLLAEDIKEELSEINKLKQVSEKIESYPIPDYSWLLELGEERKSEIRAANEARLQNRQEGVERGEVKQRYAPKQEVNKWQSDSYAWRNSPVEGRGPAPTLSEKGFNFLMTSPSFTTYDKTDYILITKKEGMEDWMLSNSQLNDMLRYETEVRANVPWPELETKILRHGFATHWTEAYKKEVYPNAPWPGLVDRFLETIPEPWTSTGPMQSMINYNNELQDGQKWDELETKILTFLKSEEGKNNLKPYHSDRYIYNPILGYVATSKKRLTPELEELLCNSEEFATRYLFKLLPHDKVREILNKFEEEATTKTSSYHASLFAVLMKELENL